MQVKIHLGWIMQLVWNLWSEIRLYHGTAGTNHWTVPWLTSPVFSGQGSSSGQTTWSAPSLIQRGGELSEPLWWRLPHHCLHPHFTLVSVIDGNVLPGPASCHDIQPRARTAAGGGEAGRRFELYWCRCKSVWAEFTLRQYTESQVVTINSMTPCQPRL